MPWQSDGRRWHIVDRVGHKGQPPPLGRGALERVVDAIEAREGFRPTGWNDRSVVEITGQKWTGGWFFHALTGDEWLLAFKIRVPKKTFDEETHSVVSST